MTPVQPAAGVLVDALRVAGVRHIFANFGSDHAAIIEALARDRDAGITSPSVILCPHEYTALSAAHGFAAVTGEPQVVMVHTDVGTANLGGAVHNAARARVPVLIFAGLTPYTLDGELPGSRTTHVNHLQDVADQHAIVRQYVKWTYDLRTGRNAAQVILRGLQISRSAPAGPVYLTSAREVLAEEVPPPAVDPAQWPPVASAAAPALSLESMLTAVRRAAAPVLVTSYLGRRPRAMAALVAFAERWGVAVVEHNPEVVNFPGDHDLHLGDNPHDVLDRADVIIAMDTDAAWLPSQGVPRDDARVFVVNEDPLQLTIPLWYAPAIELIGAAGGTVLEQLLDAGPPTAEDGPAVEARRAWAREHSAAVRRAWRDAVETDIADERLTAGVVARMLAGLAEPGTIFVTEAITEAQSVWRQLPRSFAGTLFGNRGTSLGWWGGGGLGVKLAHPDIPVVSIVGDGTYFFGVPASSFWVADRYHLPTLTVVLDNGGWGATKRNVRNQHPGQVADTTDRFFVNLQQSSDLPGIAAAAGHAWGRTVTAYDELEGALREGLAHVARGVPAVVAVRLAAISEQVEDQLSP